MSNISFKGDTLYRYSPFGGIDLFIHPDSLRGDIISRDTGTHWIFYGRQLEPRELNRRELGLSIIKNRIAITDAGQWMNDFVFHTIDAIMGMCGLCNGKDAKYTDEVCCRKCQGSYVWHHFHIITRLQYIVRAWLRHIISFIFAHDAMKGANEPSKWSHVAIN